jgi:hypothetical protein
MKITPGFNGKYNGPTIKYQALCEGCVIGPVSLQQTCCMKLGSPPVSANGSFGCPYNDKFGGMSAKGATAYVEQNCNAGSVADVTGGSQRGI